jgi:epoxyqueuosine reductase
VTQATGNDLTRSLRDLATGQLGVDLFGVAPAERLGGGPEGGRPTDYLPAARSVIVLAAKILDAVVEVAGHYDQPGKTLGPYMWYGYPVLNWDLSSAANRLARSIEAHGFSGLPFPPTGLLYKHGNRADFSHRHAAVAAGLGEIGFSGLLLTPQFGPRQRLVSIITDAPLEPSPMYDGPELCCPDHCGLACIENCPTRAMTGRTSFSIGDRTFSHARLHPVKCKWPFAEKGFRRTKVALPTDPTEEDFQAVVSSTRPHPFDAALGQFTFVPQCGACIFHCPSPRFNDRVASNRPPQHVAGAGETLLRGGEETAGR